jgi:hypothetical protein
MKTVGLLSRFIDFTEKWKGLISLFALLVSFISLCVVVAL